MITIEDHRKSLLNDLFGMERADRRGLEAVLEGGWKSESTLLKFLQHDDQLESSWLTRNAVFAVLSRRRCNGLLIPPPPLIHPVISTLSPPYSLTMEYGLRPHVPPRKQRKRQPKEMKEEKRCSKNLG